MQAMMTSFREGVLALATGAGAGGAASIYLMRSAWVNAQDLSDSADRHIVELRKLHGKHDDVASVPVRARAAARAMRASRAAPDAHALVLTLPCFLSR